MANRYFTQFIKSLQKDPVLLFARVTFGASGAPTLDASKSKGIKSITRTGAGAYTVTLGGGGPNGANADVYPALLQLKHCFLNATAPASPGMYIVSETVKTNGQINIVFNAAGTATDPASGEEVKLSFFLTNSTAQ